MRDFDDYDAQLVCLGGSAAVLAINAKFVIKLFADGPKPARDLYRELQIFEELDVAERSPYIVQFLGQWDTGIVLERLEMTLRHRLNRPNVTIESEDQWISEVCLGIEFLHSKNILHGDVGCQNILIDSRGHAKLCDFAGSKIGNENAWVRYQVRNQHPEYLGDQPTVETEIFALGSVIFEIASHRPPYEKLLDSAVQKKYEAEDFPLEEIPRTAVREIVEGCWKSTYVQVSEICDELGDL